MIIPFIQKIRTSKRSVEPCCHLGVRLTFFVFIARKYKILAKASNDYIITLEENPQETSDSALSICIKELFDNVLIYVAAVVLDLPQPKIFCLNAKLITDTLTSYWITMFFPRY